MGGLYKLFLKLTPIMLLICCICFGITHTFQQTGQSNITYLYTEQINIGTEEEPEYKNLYRFDVKSYAQNIDQDILKRSINHTIELDTYQKTLTKFNTIWEDGYQTGDASQTIINVVILTINTLILPLNIILVPIRIISGLLLTGMSLVGINITNGTFICPMLDFFVDKLAIPLIQPTIDTAQDPWNLKDTTWQYNNIPTYMNHGGTGEWTCDFNFDTANEEGHYKAIKVYFDTQQEVVTQIHYQDTSNNWIQVYQRGSGWLYNNAKRIYITINNDFYDRPNIATLQLWLTLNATEITA